MFVSGMVHIWNIPDPVPMASHEEEIVTTKDPYIMKMEEMLFTVGNCEYQTQNKLILKVLHDHLPPAINFLPTKFNECTIKRNCLM